MRLLLHERRQTKNLRDNAQLIQFPFHNSHHGKQESFMNLIPNNQKFPKTIKFIFLFFSLNISISCAQEYKVVIMLGQSNMVGAGRISDLNSMIQSYPAGIREKILIPPYYIWENVENNRKESQAWKSLVAHKDTTNTIFQYLPAFGGKTSLHGSELGLAYQLKQNRPDTNFAFIKIAVGGTTLASDWRSPSSEQDSGGYMYKRFKEGFNLAMEQAHEAVEDATIEVAGILWMQGEQDAESESRAKAYQDNLDNFITSVRSVVDNTNKDYIVNNPETPEVPFILGLITDQESLDNNCTSPDIPSTYQLTYADTIRQSQQSVCDSIERCRYFETKDYPRACGYNAEIHYNTEGLNQMGFSFAQHLNEFLD